MSEQTLKIYTDDALVESIKEGMAKIAASVADNNEESIATQVVGFKKIQLELQKAVEGLQDLYEESPIASIQEMKKELNLSLKKVEQAITSKEIKQANLDTEPLLVALNDLKKVVSTIKLDVKFPSKAKDAVAVRLSDGEKFYKAAETVADAVRVLAGGGSSLPFVEGGGERRAEVVKVNGKHYVAVVNPDGSNISGGGGSGNGTIIDGVDGSIKASVFDYTNSNPLAVRLTDTNGDYVTAAGGTQYTEDAAAAANPTGNAIILVRADSLSVGEVSANGDNIAQRGTSKGEAYTHDEDVSALLNTVNSYLSGAALESGGNLAAIATSTSNIDSAVNAAIETNGSATGTEAISVSGTDGTNARKLKTDTDGHLQVDVLTQSEITGINHGVKTVTTAGTDVALATSTTCKRVTIQSQTDNTGLIAVGGLGVDATEATGTGVILYPGDIFELEIDNLADVYIDSTVNGDGVRFTYFT